MAKRQEQEAARTEPTEVGLDILRLELPIRIPGLGHVNTYALFDEEGVALIDPGMPTPDARRDLKDRMKRAGIKTKHVHTVIVTHSHPDHFGGARWLVKEAGARLVAHDTFRFGIAAPSAEPEVSVDDLAAHGHGHGHAHGHAHSHDHDGAEPEAADEARASSPTPTSSSEAMQQGVTPWGGRPPRPPLRMRLRFRMMRLLGRSGIIPPISHPVVAGDVLKLAGREFFVQHTPGHTEDHICLHDPEEKVFIAGDHVLPTITPHISGLSTRRDPLAAFFESLDQVAALPNVEQVLPAHGHPFTDLAERCEAIKRHHDERLERIRAIGRALGPASVEAFSHELFRERSWGPMAESETYAHLEHLRLLGSAGVRRDAGGMLIYEV